MQLVYNNTYCLLLNAICLFFFTLGEVSHKLPKFGFIPVKTVQNSSNQFKLVQTKSQPVKTSQSQSKPIKNSLNQSKLVKTSQNRSKPVKWSGSQLWLLGADPFYFTLIS